MNKNGSILRDLGWWAGILLAFAYVVYLSAAGMHDGWLPTSEQKTSDLYVPSEVMIEVQANGHSTIVGAHHVSDRVKGLVGLTFSDPEAAEDEASGIIEEEYRALPDWLAKGLAFFGMKPAYAHAKNVCYNGDGTKISEETGSGRHATVHRYDRNGYRFTRTDHQHLTINGWLTDQKYYYKIDKRYC